MCVQLYDDVVGCSTVYTSLYMCRLFVDKYSSANFTHASMHVQWDFVQEN